MRERRTGPTGRSIRHGMVAALLLATAYCPAQYKVYSWESFETGALPPALQMKFNSGADSVSVIDYTSPGAPPGIRNGIAQVECGRYGLLVQGTPAKRFQAVVSPVTLNRQQLGANGKALFQADFYLPAEGEEPFSFAVLAVAKDTQARQSIWKMYRLGIQEAKLVFFSYADGDKKQGVPILSRTQPAGAFNLARPGWHRLQIVFQGQEQIICAVDGIATNFSPISEPSFTELQAGMFIVTAQDKPQVCLADNLSVQWTTEDIPLPDSPWAGGAASSAFIPAAPASPGSPAATPGVAVKWHLSPDDAWAQSTAEKRPILVLFHTPTSRAYATLGQTLTTNPAAQQLVARFVPLRVDVNQLSGSAIAERFGIFRVPTFVVIGPDGKERQRITIEENIPWPSIAAQLQTTLATP